VNKNLISTVTSNKTPIKVLIDYNFLTRNGNL